MAQQNHASIFDSALELKDAYLVAADAAAQVDSANKIVDLGADSYWRGEVVIDVSAVEVASNDERFDVDFQLSASSSFGSGVVSRAICAFGAFETIIGTSADTPVGRYRLFVDNEVGGTLYRYARLYTNVTGSVATGINYSAFAAPL